MRRFLALVGATAPASAAAVASVFAGMAIGSVLAGRLARRIRRPRLALAGVLAAVGLSALMVEPLLRLLDPAGWPGGGPTGPSGLLAARILTALLSVLAPSLFMGATIPLAAEALARHAPAGLGIRAAGLLAMNTLGAAAGVLAVPLWLLPTWGASGSSLAASTASLLLAALSLHGGAEIVSGGPDGVGGDGDSAGSGSVTGPSRSNRLSDRGLRPPRHILRSTMGALLSGGLVLAVEVSCVRMLALVHENSVRSFAVVLAVFLIGLAAGAGVARVLLRRGHSSERLLPPVFLACGILIAALPREFLIATGGMSLAPGIGGAGAGELGAVALLAGALLLPIATALGMIFPLVVDPARVEPGSSGAILGRLLAVNAAGAIAGPAAAVFLVAPRTGLWWCLWLCGLVSLGAGVLAGAGTASPRRRVMAVACAAGAALLVPVGLPRARLEAGERLVSLREGPFGAVAVVESEGTRRILIDNLYVVGGTASTGPERFQGHLPLMLHPAPARVAFLGLGTGISAGATSDAARVRDVTVVELVPEIARAASEEFREANRGVLEDPRTRLVLDDAKAWLRRTDARYDVIVGDLFVPWRRGEANLYGREAFAAARRALAPGGVFCQWVPLYQLREAGFASILRTFSDVFPGASVWRGDFDARQPAVALIGWNAGEIDPQAVARNTVAYAAVPDPTNPWFVDPAGVWIHLLGPIPSEASWVRQAKLSTDAFPWVELLATPLREGALTGAAASAALAPLRTAELDGTSLARLGPRERAWGEIGDALFRASLLGLQGQNSAADQTGWAALARLPDSIQSAFHGGAKSVGTAAEAPDLQ